jgi:hypothetical protein
MALLGVKWSGWRRSVELSAADEGERAGERVMRLSNLILDSRSAGGLPAAEGRSWGGWPRGSIDGCWGRFASDRPTAQAQEWIFNCVTNCVTTGAYNAESGRTPADVKVALSCRYVQVTEPLGLLHTEEFVAVPACAAHCVAWSLRG